MRPGSPSLLVRLAAPLAVVLTVIVAFGAAMFPLTGTLGWESAQILSAVLGPLMLLVGAVRGSVQRERGFAGDLAMQAATVAVAAGLYVAVIAFAELSHESCAPSRGLLPFVFFPLPVVVLHSALGLWIGRTVGNAKWAAIVAVLALSGLLFWLFLTWAWAPSFRFLSHFFVVIDGDLLAGRPIRGATVAFRFATAFYAAAVVFAGFWRFPKSRRAGLSSGPSGSNTALVATAVFVVLGLVTDNQASSAIAPSRSDLEETYSIVATRGALIVRADPLVHTTRDVDSMLAEGALWMERLQERMGVSPSAPITIWLHKDRPTLGKWTGAEHVHFALPGQRELHVTDAEAPHRSLGHELAHVLGRELSSSFLGVPTKFVIFINAGITEGLAMAVTPEIEARRELSLDQEAAALRRGGLAPDARALFSDSLSSFRFWQQAPGRAYVTAGSLMNALLAEKGSDGLKLVYESASLSAAFANADELEAFISAHEKRLDALELPPDALGAVTRRHRRDSILNQTCDGAKLEAAKEVRAAANQGAFDAAEKRAVEADGSLLPETLALFADAATKLDRPAKALDSWVRRAALDAKDDVRGASERMDDAADALWRADRRRQAIAYWARTDIGPVSPGRARAIQAKRILAEEVVARAGTAPISIAALALLIKNTKTPDTVVLVSRLAEAIATDVAKEAPAAKETARYILARQYAQRGMPSEAVLAFLNVYGNARDVLPASIREQTLIGLAVAHARRGDWALASHGFHLVAEKTERLATRIHMRDFEARAARAAAALSLPPEDPKRGDLLLLGTTPGGRW